MASVSSCVLIVRGGSALDAASANEYSIGPAGISGATGINGEDGVEVEVHIVG